MKVAEREGFEPSEEFPPHMISSHADSARLSHLSGHEPLVRAFLFGAHILASATRESTPKPFRDSQVFRRQSMGAAKRG
jgi:hypothetical protein